MPCWEVRTMSVEFKAGNRKLLKQAIASLGWTVSTEGSVLTITELGTIDLREGVATITTTNQGRLNLLKQRYSREAIKRAAKLRGWQFKSATQTKGVLRR